MNRNAIVGLVLVLAAVGLAFVVVGTVGRAAEDLIGKAVWYVPYAALVWGVRTLVRARG